MDLWGMANALGAAVKQQTQEIASSLQNTDWKSELVALKKGLKEDTEEIGQVAKTVTEELGHRTLDMAKQLPSAVDEGRRKAVATLEQLPTSSAAVQDRAKEATAQIQKAGSSLSNFGQRIMLSTTELFDQLSHTIQTELATAHGTHALPSGHKPPAGLGKDSIKFSRFEADVAAMQRDSSTYCDEPEDGEEFTAWLETFDLQAFKPEISRLIGENTFMSELQSRIVPVVVNYDDFWTRYFYRLHKLEDKHAKVVALTKRAEKATEDINDGWGSEEEDDLWIEQETPALVQEQKHEEEEKGEEEEEAVRSEEPQEEEEHEQENVQDVFDEAVPEEPLTAQVESKGENAEPEAVPEVEEEEEKIQEVEDTVSEEEDAASKEVETAAVVEEEIPVAAVVETEAEEPVAASSSKDNIVDSENVKEVENAAPSESKEDAEQQEEQSSDKKKKDGDKEVGAVPVAELSVSGGVGSGGAGADEDDVDLDDDWGDDVAEWE